MNSRARVVAALTRRSLPDRVPVQFDLSRALADRFCHRRDRIQRKVAKEMKFLRLRVSRILATLR